MREPARRRAMVFFPYYVPRTHTVSFEGPALGAELRRVVRVVAVGATGLSSKEQLARRSAIDAGGQGARRRGTRARGPRGKRSRRRRPPRRARGPSSSGARGSVEGGLSAHPKTVGDQNKRLAENFRRLRGRTRLWLYWANSHS